MVLAELPPTWVPSVELNLPKLLGVLMFRFVDDKPKLGWLNRLYASPRNENETFSVTLTVEGVYDYFCIPHEHAGMVGRIVVGHPDTASAAPSTEGGAPSVPEPAQRAFPAVDEIMRRRIVRRT